MCYARYKILIWDQIRLFKPHIGKVEQNLAIVCLLYWEIHSREKKNRKSYQFSLTLARSSKFEQNRLEIMRISPLLLESTFFSCEVFVLFSSRLWQFSMDFRKFLRTYKSSAWLFPTEISCRTKECIKAPTDHLKFSWISLLHFNLKINITADKSSHVLRMFCMLAFVGSILTQ